MWTVKRLVTTVGHPIQAEVLLLQHYAAKQQTRYHWDRRHAAMEFVVRWAPLFRRHFEFVKGEGHDGTTRNMQNVPGSNGGSGHPDGRLRSDLYLVRAAGSRQSRLNRTPALLSITSHLDFSRKNSPSHLPGIFFPKNTRFQIPPGIQKRVFQRRSAD